MELNSAHEGYEYQDLLTAYFILDEILRGNESIFHIDKKLSSTDAFDDLTIERKKIRFKKQIKYSDTHTLEKKDISANSGYQLAINNLFDSWNNQRDEVRLCLAWSEPTDELREVFSEVSGDKTFSTYPTKLFRVDIDKLWPENDKPSKKWKRLRESTTKIDRNNFAEFCNHFLIETNFPKFSLDIDNPGDLEKIVLEQSEKIGVGTFPNQHLSSKSFISQLLLKIKKARSSGSSIHSQSIFNWFKIKTDYGAIEQTFPVDLQKNIPTKTSLDRLFEQLQKYKKIILTGEPGSGKSWLVNNFIEIARKKKIHIVRHFCYTDLKDELQIERIKRDVFYGNLITDILKEFPSLKDKKEQLYASSLSELNLIIENISEPTILIIDGLDHIERVYDFYQRKDITKNDIQIFEDIKQIKYSKNVSVLLASQPINELNDLQDFRSFELPKWTNTEVELLLGKYHIQNITVNDNKISAELLKKSEGNPLYLTYILKEISTYKDTAEFIIRDLPDYSFNLKEYYDYLIIKLNTREALPRILSGVNFYLTKNELKEITGEGNYVDEVITSLSPILRLNISQNGYIIYHESFRRYILDVLRDKKVSIQQNIFDPIITWFKSKNFFSYNKAYRYALKFYYDCRQYTEIESFIQKDFIVNSVICGQPWQQIEHNVYILSRAAICLKDLRFIIIVNELFKTVGTAIYNYEESFLPYLECIGLLKGFEQVANFLTFEGKPTVDLKQGLAACYLCSNYDSTAPWNLYFDYFEKDGKIKLEDFKYYLKYLIINKDTEKIAKIANKVKKLPQYKTIFKEELEIISDNKYKHLLLKETPPVTEIFTEKNYEIKDINEIISNIKDIEHYNEATYTILNDFICQCKFQVRDDISCDNIVKQLFGINWFYNWLIYCVKIAYLQNKPDIKFEEIRQAFSYLIYDLEPFKGKPRTCDLYFVEPLIYKTLKNGLSLIKTFDELKFAIDAIIKVSEKTTTSLTGSIGGPISTDKLFTLFCEIFNPVNGDYLIQKVIEIYNGDKTYRFFSYLSDYCFAITKLCYKANRIDDANFYFQLAARYMISYTSHKDRTLSDGIECMTALAKIDIDMSKKYSCRVKELADSVTKHTDGKETQWFPITWFEEYIKIDREEATLWLRNQLSHHQLHYDFRLEQNIKDLIMQTKGSINPVLEQFIFNSFIVDNSESYLKYAIKINEKVNNKSNELALFFAKKISLRLENKSYSSFSENIRKEVHSHLYALGIETSDYVEKPTDFIKEKENYTKHINTSSPNFSEMSLMELGKYINQAKLSDLDISCLAQIINKLPVNENTKQFVKNCVIKKYRWENEINLEALDKLFQDNKKLGIYYNVLVFVWIIRGNDRCFGFANKFTDAYFIDPNKTMEYFFELLPMTFTGINMDFSSNLLKVLTKVEFDSQILKDAFSNLIDCIDYKIPVADKYNWDDEFKNELRMNMEELLITILLLRSKAYTYDRLINTLTGFAWILYNEPDKLIKPLRYIFGKHNIFLESVLLCFLDILFDYHKINPKYILNFKTELEKLYPTRYYLIDCILEKLFNKSPHKTLIKPLLYYNTDDANKVISLNGRLQKLQTSGLDSSYVASKFKLTYKSRYEDKMDLYGNKLYKIMAENIYPSDYILDIINKDLYNDLRELQKEENDDLYEYLRINTKVLTAQNLSFSKRPSELPLPSKKEKKLSRIPISSVNGWIRLCHFETELKEEERHRDLSEHKCSGTFSTEYSTIDRLDCLYNTVPLTRCSNVVLQYIEHDLLKKYQIFWLNPIIMDKLKIKINHFLNGLAATNEQNEVVLKYNQWRYQYIGNGERGLPDEISLIEGMELLIREDYFNKITDIIGQQINLYTMLYF